MKLFTSFLLITVDLVQSATLFRKAAGVYNYSAQELRTNLSWSQERPPEAIPSVSSIMSLVCLADAQVMNFCNLCSNYSLIPFSNLIINLIGRVCYEGSRKGQHRGFIGKVTLRCERNYGRSY